MTSSSTTTQNADWADLNDWVVCNHPELWEATKYLHLEHQVQSWKTFWRAKGCPDLETVQ